MSQSKLLKIVDRHLYDISDDFVELQQMVESGDIGPDEVGDTLEAISCEFEYKAHQVAVMISNISEPLEAISMQIKRLQAREKSIKNKTDSFRKYLKANMQKLGKDRISGDLFNITLAKGRESVVVDDAHSLPDEYVIVKTEILPDKMKIKSDIKDGGSIPGAHLERGEPTIQIR